MKKRGTTEQFAQIFSVKPDTVRRALCVNGEYMGLRPVKLPTGRLLWPLDLAEELLDQVARKTSVST